jgi:hypothetical protein
MRMMAIYATSGKIFHVYTQENNNMDTSRNIFGFMIIGLINM